MREVQACGVFCVRHRPRPEFLLLRRQNEPGFDLPKGHREEGESEVECALRELWEETGIEPGRVQLDPTFRFTTHYQYFAPYWQEMVQKELVIFLGYINQTEELQMSEHVGYEWVTWRPGLTIQKETIDEVLAQLELFWKE